MNTLGGSSVQHDDYIEQYYIMYLKVAKRVGLKYLTEEKGMVVLR